MKGFPMQGTSALKQKDDKKFINRIKDYLIWQKKY